MEPPGVVPQATEAHPHIPETSAFNLPMFWKFSIQSAQQTMNQTTHTSRTPPSTSHSQPHPQPPPPAPPAPPQVLFMQSDGGLASVNSFSGHKAILSGPAGGYVGYALTTKWKGGSQQGGHGGRGQGRGGGKGEGEGQHGGLGMQVGRGIGGRGWGGVGRD